MYTGQSVYWRSEGVRTHMLTQQEAIATYMPLIEEEGSVYEKFTEVEARLAVPGEIIVTVTTAGVETRNAAQPGDFVVRNLTAAREEYILSAKKLAARYLPLGDASEPGWQRFKATGEVRAFWYLGPNTEFTASWGEPMQLHTRDMLCTPLPQKDEVYRIAAKEFVETYRLKTI